MLFLSFLGLLVACVCKWRMAPQRLMATKNHARDNAYGDSTENEQQQKVSS